MLELGTQYIIEYIQQRITEIKELKIKPKRVS